jgi:hypothetical protein
MGQIVIFPYYSVQGNMSTFFNVTNTSTSALAVKVRFHEAVNSRDVLDFNILMSPLDAWTGYLVPNANGGVTLMTDDNSCTSPLIPATGLTTAKRAYTGASADTGPDGADRSKEGYVEMMVMGQCDDGDSCFDQHAVSNDSNSDPGIGWLTEHVAGTPRDCAQADNYFEATVDWDPTKVPGSGKPIAADATYGYHAVTVPYPLKGNLTLLDISNGIAGGNAALHIGNILPTGNELVTAQQYPWFLEPTIATAPKGVLWNTVLLYLLEDRINASNVINEWSTNPDNGVASDWVVTFPTKGFHVDQFCNQIQANNSAWRYDNSAPGEPALTCATGTSADQVTGLTAGVDFEAKNGLNPEGPTVAPFEERFADGKSDITTLYGLFDREEGGRTASGTAPSPAPPSVLPLMPHEANVIGFTSADDPNSAVESPNVQPVDASAILNDAPYGWADLTFPDAGNNSQLPVTGFMVKTRTFGTPDKHYGQIQNHGYKPAGAN